MIGLIGGSGFYSFFDKVKSKTSGKPKLKEVLIKTKYGLPSDKIIIGKIFGKEVAFLPRHGRKHVIPPHKINYKANIAALKALGVDRIIAPAAVGSLQAKIKPGEIVFCSQFIDRTKNRLDTFFDGPDVAHIETASPYCDDLREIAIKEAKRSNFKFHPNGAVVVIEGPRFSTAAESMWFSKMGWDVVNMTQYPEAVLASEIGICYLNISLVTDYDAGIYAGGKAAPVSIEQVLKNFAKNTEDLKILILAIIKQIPDKHSCDCLDKSKRALIS